MLLQLSGCYGCSRKRPYIQYLCRRIKYSAAMRAVFTYDIFISDISPAMSFSVVCKYRTLCVCIGLWRTALACSRPLARRVGKAWGRLFVRVKEPFATGLGGCSPNMDTNPGSGAGRNLFTATQPNDASPNNNTAPQPSALNTAGAAPLRGAATTPTGTFHCEVCAECSLRQLPTRALYCGNVIKLYTSCTSDTHLF